MVGVVESIASPLMKEVKLYISLSGSECGLPVPLAVFYLLQLVTSCETLAL